MRTSSRCHFAALVLAVALVVALACPAWSAALPGSSRAGGFSSPGNMRALNPQPEPPFPVDALAKLRSTRGSGLSSPGSIRAFNPQPEPPGRGTSKRRIQSLKSR